MLDWMKHKLESRVLGEISVPSDMQMTPPLRQKKKNKTDQQKKNKWKFTHTCIAQTQEHSAVSNSEEWLELGLI